MFNVLEYFKQLRENQITKLPTEMELINERLAYELETALFGKTIEQFAKYCNLITKEPLTDILDLKLSMKPSRDLLRRIANNSDGNVTYKRLYEICGYSEFDSEEDKKWLDYQPKRGDLVYLDLGFNWDSEQSGIRPCLIYQNNRGNKYSSTIVIIPLTSKLRTFGKTHVILTQEDGLKSESFLLAEQIRVVSKRRVYFNGRVNKITTLSEEKMNEVKIAVDFELGHEDLDFNEDKANTLISQVKALRYNIEHKKSRDLIEIYKEKKQEFKDYCAKHDKDYKEVIRAYNNLDLQYA